MDSSPWLVSVLCFVVCAAPASATARYPPTRTNSLSPVAVLPPPASPHRSSTMDAFPSAVPGGPGSFGPTGEAPKRAHLYIGNLSARVTEYMLQEIFAVAGPVQGVKIIPDRTMQHGGANYGFVEFYTLHAAETALQTLNGRKIFDMEIRCNWAYQNQSAKEDLTNHCHLFVGDLSSEVNDEVLQKAFMAFGSLSDARVMWDMNSGKSRGYGFLAFRDKTDAEQAIATMNGEWLGSRAIRVNYANQKNQETAGIGNVAPPDGGQFGNRPGGGAPQGGMGGPPPHMGGPPPMGGGMHGGPPHMGQGPMGGAPQPPAPAPIMAPPAKLYGGPPPSLEVVAAQSPAHNTTIYVGNLVPYTTQADLAPLFQGFGYIVEIRMQADRGFAFVKLDSHENAARAIVNLQGVPVHGRQLKCSWGKATALPAGETAPATPPVPQAQSPQPQYPVYMQQPQYAGFASPQGPAAAFPPQLDPAAAAAAAAWQAQYGAQYAAYIAQQQAAMAAQAQQQPR